MENLAQLCNESIVNGFIWGINILLASITKVPWLLPLAVLSILFKPKKKHFH